MHFKHFAKYTGLKNFSKRIVVTLLLYLTNIADRHLEKSQRTRENRKKMTFLRKLQHSNFEVKYSYQTIGKRSMNAIKPNEKISGNKATNT